MMASNRADDGFTLLEVMVALAIISIALVSLLGTHLMSLNLAQKNKEQALMAMLAREKMEEVFSTEFDSINNNSGDFGPQHPEYEWEETVNEDETDNLKNVKLVVSSPAGSLTLETSVAKAAVK
jgi:general secretion pathway protein I